jgi:carboxypeptidase D
MLTVFRVDQPVGVGYSNGTPTATTEEEIAADFVEFFERFQESYGIKNFRIFLTGESYAGRYVPYISAAMLDKNDTEHFDLSGMILSHGGAPSNISQILIDPRSFDV